MVAGSHLHPFQDLHQVTIAEDSGLPRVIIQFRMLQAISASASWDFG
jgi:hypothetical protein